MGCWLWDRTHNLPPIVITPLYHIHSPLSIGIMKCGGYHFFVKSLMRRTGISLTLLKILSLVIKTSQP